MAYILFADEVRDEEHNLAIQPAADHFAAEGHEVVVLSDGHDAKRFLSERAPDVLVTGLVLLRASAAELVQLLDAEHPGNPTRRLVMTSTLAEGGPWRDWSLPVHSYVVGRETGRLVLAIEQLLFRHVSIDGTGAHHQAP